MSRADRMRSSRLLFTVILVGVALAGAALISVATGKYGVGASPDSVAYLSAARSLRHGSLVTYSGEAYIMWPPGLPALLAAIPGDPLVSARYLNVLCIAALTLLVGVWTKQAAGRVWGLVAAVVVATAIPLLHVHSFLWSEPLFILLTTASLYCLSHFGTRPRSSILVAAALLAAMAALTRYSGIALLVVGICLLSLDASRSRRARAGSAFLYVAIGGIPLAIWLLRNWVVAGSLTERLGTNRPLSEHLWGAWWELRGWTSVHASISPLARALHIDRDLASVQALPVVAIVCLIVWYSWHSRKSLYRRAIAESSFRTAIAFSVGYSVLMLYMAATSNLDALGDRLLSPIFPSLLVGSLIAAAQAWRIWIVPDEKRRLTPRLLLAAVLVFACLFVPSRALEVHSLVATEAAHGIPDYSTDWWMHSQTLASARDWGPGIVFSDYPDSVYYRTGRTARFFPTLDAGLGDWLRTAKAERVILVHVDHSPLHWSGRYTYSQLLRYLPRGTTTVYRDGAVATSAVTEPGHQAQ